MNRKQVYISSYGAICGLGCNVGECVDRIVAEETAITAQTHISMQSGEPMFASRVNNEWISPFSSKFSRLERMMLTALEEAKAERVAYASHKTIFIFSTTKGNIFGLNRLRKEGYMLNLAKRITEYYANPNHPVIISNACISGVLASEYAFLLLSSGKYENAVVVGGDEFTKFVATGFDSFHSMSSRPCRPYDKDRDGVSLGEAAAVIVYTTDEKKSDESGVLLHGGASSNDANHISGPSRTGDGLAETMNKALAQAGMNATDIPLVLAHGTATVYNDEMECKALRLAGLESAALVSLKGYFGHTLGASGLLETVMMLELMKRGVVPRTLGYSENGLSEEMKVSSVTERREISGFLKSASGFGGCNCSVVFAKSAIKPQVFPKKECRSRKKVEIRQSEVIVNGECLFKSDNSDEYSDFIRSAFRNVSSEPYMKFAKMDDFCKLALTAVEYLVKDENLKDKEVAVVLHTSTGCLESDRQHKRNIGVFGEGASPAVFVYTLPNIAVGEIAIRNKFKGENLTRIVKKCDETELFADADLLLSNGGEVVVALYADFSREGGFECQCWLID